MRNSKLSIIEHELSLPKSITTIDALTAGEILGICDLTRSIKQNLANMEKIHLKLNPAEWMLYLVFLEPSTRTLESFYRAAVTCGLPVREFIPERSSLNKGEGFLETFRMLRSYSQNTVFVVRTSIEGLSAWLDIELSELGDENNYGSQLIINAGDGKHEHPTQELLDEYTFLEQKQFDNRYLHLALIGDLKHSRTVHSKIFGLRIWENVVVDLVSPPQLQLPIKDKESMLELSYEVREFENLEDYLKHSSEVADVWYFTRLQLERMDEKTRANSDELRRLVSVNERMMNKIPEAVRFYHPLPRYKKSPVIPFEVDNTRFDGYHKQAINGYYTRIALLLTLIKGIEEFGSKSLPEFQNQESLSCENVACVSNIIKDEIVKVRTLPYSRDTCYYCGHRMI